MEGLSSWIWVMGGVIVGLIMFVLFLQIISMITISRENQFAKENFQMLTTKVNSFCDVSVGNSESQHIVIPEIIGSIFASKDEKSFELVDGITYGNFLCMNLTNSVTCNKVNCKIEVVKLSPKESVISLVDKYLGRFSSDEVNVEVSKTKCGVSVLEPGMKTQCVIPFYLIKCSGNSVVTLIKNLLVIGDSTYLYRCCSEKTENFEKLLVNSAKFFGGQRILIIWEDEGGNPNDARRVSLLDKIKQEGFLVDAFYHVAPVKYENIAKYDQVWLYRPGICENSKLEKYCNYKWEYSEFDALKSFLSRGKIILVTDYSDAIPHRVSNKIIEKVNPFIELISGCSCGCGASAEMTREISPHAITSGIDYFYVDAAATGFEID